MIEVSEIVLHEADEPDLLTDLLDPDIPGGFAAPIHSHTADYRAVVIEGTWTHWFDENTKGEAVELRPGSYWTQPADKRHGDACVSETPCTILLINSDPYETTVRQEN
ncbi:MAG: DUF4437 domain-containing protein [Woeseiaceae bacterium]